MLRPAHPPADDPAGIGVDHHSCAGADQLHRLRLDGPPRLTPPVLSHHHAGVIPTLPMQLAIDAGAPRRPKPCLVGIEACATGHHWARVLMALGHEVRLMRGRRMAQIS